MGKPDIEEKEVKPKICPSSVVELKTRINSQKV
jgi:hypothetical protein